MVVTIEPGIYFSVYALQHFYLPSPIHSKYINSEVVARYLPVGGVRIEDDLLITANGYENLTTAPKGEDMLKIIRGEKVAALRPSKPRSIDDADTQKKITPLRRAPGISRDVPVAPLRRASTLPTELKQEDSVDFEPFHGPSLFSNFKRSMTTNENVRRWKQSHELASSPLSPPPANEKLSPVCGDGASDFQHVYMSTASNLAAASRAQGEEESRQPCKNCAILVQTLDRLRQNLTTSLHSSPKQ